MKMEWEKDNSKRVAEGLEERLFKDYEQAIKDEEERYEERFRCHAVWEDIKKVSFYRFGNKPYRSDPGVQQLSAQD